MADVRGDIGQQAWSAVLLRRPRIIVMKFKKMFVLTFDEYWDSGLYNLRYNLLDLEINDITRMGGLLVLKGSP